MISHPNRHIVFAGVATLALGGVACGSSLALAPRAEQAPNVDLVEVPRPPPAPLPEVIEPAPEHQDPLVWADGCWTWSAGRWVWVRGGWVVTPLDATYWPSQTYFTQQGTILASPCVWQQAGRVIDSPEQVAPAAFPRSARVVEDR